MTKNFKFSKKLRLLTSSHFTFVFQKPQLVKVTYITILSRYNGLGYPRIGLIISKKSIKYAYIRNRIKRLIRESFRLHQHILLSLDFIVMVKKKIININNHTLTEILEKLWYRHRRLVPEC